MVNLYSCLVLVICDQRKGSRGCRCLIWCETGNWCLSLMIKLLNKTFVKDSKKNKSSFIELVSPGLRFDVFEQLGERFVSVELVSPGLRFGCSNGISGSI